MHTPITTFRIRLLVRGWLAFVFIWCAGWCTPLFAHGDLEERIEGVTAEIAKNPNDAKLYVLRAELFRLHQEFDEAFADLDKAADLDPALAETAYVRARVYADQQMPTAALAAFAKNLQLAPNHVEGYVARAQLQKHLKQYAPAAADYAQAITRARDPLPEYYIERARLLVLAATPLDDGVAAAVATLDAGIARLGSLITLELAALDIEAAAGKYDRALQRIEGCMAQAPRKEMWLERKGQILEKAGRPAEASIAYGDGLKAIADLPAHHQTMPVMIALKDRLTAACARLSQPAALLETRK